MRRFTGLPTFAVAMLAAMLMVAMLWSMALVRPTLLDKPRPAPFAHYEAILGNRFPGAIDCWPDAPYSESGNQEHCWTRGINVTVENGRVTSLFARLEGVAYGDVLLWYGQPPRVDVLGERRRSIVKYEAMWVYVSTVDGLTPHSRVVALSLWVIRETERG